MIFGKDIFCHGIEPYNFRDTEETVATITANVGQSTAIGPKVAIRLKRPFPPQGEVVAIDMGGRKSSSNFSHNICPTITCTHGGEPVIGTIDASIYKKNSNQDNSKYIIEKRKKKTMENPNIELLLKAAQTGVDIGGLMASLEAQLKLVRDEILSIDEAIKACEELRETIETDNEDFRDGNMEYVKESGKGMKQENKIMKDAIKDINKDAPHQQAQLNCQDEAARTLAVSTHGAASHLTKTVVEGEDEDGEEMCVVRRLTPTETARLQGFPDDYSKIDGDNTADAPQFKAHGNSWATPCANFFNTRIDMELRRLGHKGTINYATCCSGIEAHSVSVRNLDWKSLFFSEIEPFPCRVLAAHYPDTPNLGDMTQIHFDEAKGCITNAHKVGEEYYLPKEFNEAPIQELTFKVGDFEVFSGGTPCTDISIAGKRQGMGENSGTRSSLAWHYQRIIDETRPMFTLWENVPGAFSSNGGADFIWFVNRCAESGYAMAWRVIDAQYTMTEEFPRAVPQRRRRIWLVGYRGNDWRIPARIVFELDKNLTSNPPDRIPGKGFKTLNKDYVDIEEVKSIEEKAKNQNLFGLVLESDDGRERIKKVAKMIDFSEMPNEADFSKVLMADIYSFAKKVGEPGYIGSVFRTDKKKAKSNTKKFATCDLFSMLDEESPKELIAEVKIGDEIEWVGAEKISPAILENIGNAGILANGRIATINCHEWTSGIQLSPKTYTEWEKLVKDEEWLKANDLLPEAYDETVCGLSDVLQENPDEKYNLSWRACFGILKRAKTRGKELPAALGIALVSTIRENAGIVKWYALNGKETKKKEGDLSERENAILCFNEYIAPVLKFEDVDAIQPKRRNDGESDNGEEDDDEEIEMDEEGNPILADGDEDGLVSEDISNSPKRLKAENEEMPELPNGVINVSGGETAATLIASGDAAVGTTQDANVIALKKEGRFQKEENEI